MIYTCLSSCLGTEAVAEYDPTLPDHALHITVSLSSCLGTEANAEYSPPLPDHALGITPLC